jgi:hypothetical protein
MRMLFYDKSAYAAAQTKEPSLRWTWEELAHDMTAVSDPDSPKLHQWGFMDVSSDVLFSYAYNWKNDCTEEATVRCARPLTDVAAAAALEWYAAMAGESGQMPNLLTVETDFGLDDWSSRNYVLDNWQSARRRSVIWVDEPIDYEFRFLPCLRLWAWCPSPARIVLMALRRCMCRVMSSASHQNGRWRCGSGSNSSATNHCAPKPALSRRDPLWPKRPVTGRFCRASWATPCAPPSPLPAPS